MRTAVDLIVAVLRGACGSAEDASRVLAQAAALGIDPLEHCARDYGLGADIVWRRAAAWAGLAFSSSVPDGALTMPPPQRLDALAFIHTAAGRIYDRRVVFSAPGLLEIVTLAEALTSRPHLAATLCIVTPAALRHALARHHSAGLMTEARQRLARRWPQASAHLDLTLTARIAFVLFLLLVVVMVLAAPFVLQPVLLPLTALLLTVPAAMRLLALAPGLIPPPLTAGKLLGDEELPVYSVLVPLRNEVQMVPNLVRALSALDYPAGKLDIKFVVEGRSQATVAAVTGFLEDPRFELITVPDEHPRTKPKALNYALPFVRGAHAVVFDAEDIPHPRQLRQAASLFATYPEYDCLQAELTIDNGGENWLTAMFAGEYAGQFGFLLPALAHWRLPMPLGGTSNHFRMQALRELGGWDAFNVTEDADLGVRLARLRYRSATFQSATREEAPIRLRAWMAQRSRWMKGWMQTFIVHNRQPLRFLADIGWRGFLAFEIYVGSLIISSLLHTAFLAVTLARLALMLPFIEDRFDAWTLLQVLTLVFGYGGAMLIFAAGLARLGKGPMLMLQVTLPIYWMLHSLATARAAYELIRRPFFWAKTEHGRTRMARSGAVAAVSSHREGARQYVKVGKEENFFRF